MDKKNRSTYIDIVKAFTILCVVCGHCIQYGSGANYLSQELFFENILFKFIYSFHMPLFMLISGYLFAFTINKLNWKQLILSKIKTLVIPIMIWSMIPWGLHVIRLYQSNEEMSILSVIKSYIGTSLENLWFLWAIFWCSLCVIIIKQFFKDNIWIYIFVGLLTFVVPDILGLYLYKFMYPFFVIGYFYNKTNGKEKMKRMYDNTFLLFLNGAVFVVLLLLYNYNSYIYTSGYCVLGKNVVQQIYNDIFRFIIGMVGSTFVMLVIHKTAKYIHDKLINCICLIGQNTLGIYIISGFVFTYVLNRVVCSFVTINYLVMVIETIIILAFSLLCTLGIKKLKILNRFLLGGR